jgi:hypothetical protein
VSFPDREDLRERYGLDPQPGEEEYLRSLMPGLDEYRAAVRLTEPSMHYTLDEGEDEAA